MESLKAIRAHGNQVVKVSGVAEYQDLLEEIGEPNEHGVVKAMQTATLESEWDDVVVTVLIRDEEVGCLPQAKAEAYQPLVLRADEAGYKITCDATLVGGFEKANGDIATIGVHLKLPKPKELEAVLNERIAPA